VGDGTGKVVLVESATREIVVVLLVALIGLLVTAAIVLAPWHPATASTVVDMHSPH
jgi:hypothetical protein